MVANPMFVTQSRAVRGYSLSVLGATVAIVCVLEYVRRADEPGARRVWLLTGHAIGIVVAMGTHGFAGVALGPIGLAALVLLGRLDRRLILSWIGAAAGLVAVYVWTIAQLLDTADARGTRYLSFFGELVVQELLGRDPVTVAILGGLVVFAALGVVMRVEEQPPRAGTAVMLVGGLVVAQGWYLWQIAQPFDLYPRFFLSVVPLVAIAVGVAVGRQPQLVALVVLAVALVFGEVRAIRDSELPLRDAGEAIVAASGLGWEVCAVGADPLRLYTAGVPVREIPVPTDPATVDFGECGVFLRVGSWGSPVEPVAAQRFAFSERLGPIGLYSQVPLSLLGR
jgi:4-amino-4-deoxy-L-arabinose transferase-like glycosyltransferase